MTEEVEINYDKDGIEKSVVVTYGLYLEMLAAKDEFDELKNKLNQLYYVLSDIVAQPEPSLPSEIASDIDTKSTTEFETDSSLDSSEPDKEQHDIRYYQRARGYYVDSQRFCVLAGSKVRGTPSTTFNSMDTLTDLRDLLISNGSLAREHEWGDYEFLRDCVFGSPSAAACIVDGNSRSGPVAWGRPRTY